MFIKCCVIIIIYRTLICILTVRYIFYCAKIYIFNKCCGRGQIFRLFGL